MGPGARGLLRVKNAARESAELCGRRQRPPPGLRPRTAAAHWASPSAASKTGAVMSAELAFAEPGCGGDNKADRTAFACMVHPRRVVLTQCQCDRSGLS